MKPKRRRAPAKSFEPELLEQLPVAVFYTVDEKIHWVNAAASELLGFEREELVGRGMFDIVEPEERARLEERYWARQRGQTPPPAYEVRTRRKDGVVLTVEILPRSLGGRRQLAMAMDITRRVRGTALAADTIENLQRRNRELASIQELARVSTEADFDKAVVKLLQIATNASASDRALLHLLDSERGELVLAGAHGQQGPVHERYRRVSLTSPPLAAELSQLRPSVHQAHSAQTNATVQAAVLPLHLHGRLSGMLSLVRDRQEPYGLDDVRMAESLAAQVAIQVENARLYADAHRRVHDLSLINELGDLIRQHLELNTVLDTGVRNLARIADVPNAILLLLVPGTRTLRISPSSVSSGVLQVFDVSLDDQTAASTAIQERRAILIDDATTDPRASRELVARFGYKSILALPLVARGEPVGAVVLGEKRPERRFGAGEVERAVAVSNQLAIAIANARLYEDARRSYESLARTQRELVKRERLAALGELAAIVAHEVRNPLAVIFNSLGSIKKLGAVGQDAHMLLDIVGEEADRLNRIVSDLLDFARPHEPALQPESLEGLIAGALEAATSTHQQTPVRLEMSVPKDFPPVPADARLLRQAFINLVVNAIQASPKGGRVRLEASAERENERTVARVDVIDDGPGIPAAMSDQIFQPFFTTKATGTGLGLAVVKRIVEAHRGEIAFRSRPGQGTTFTIRLPTGDGPDP